jgi:nucleotide-binding universal stress UspA family protein
MTQLAKVLVASDFSSASADALGRATQLPLARDSTITLLHVLPPDLPERLGLAVRHAAERRLRGEPAAAMAASRASAAAFTIVPRIEAGDPVDVICREAEASRAELIVVGRTGLGRTRARPLGSTSERVTRVSATPVLVVAAAPAGPYRRPLVGVDGSAVTHAAVNLALRVIEPDVRSLELVHAYDAPGLQLLRELDASDADIDDYVARFGTRARERLEPMLAALPRESHELRRRFVTGDAREVLLREARSHKADVLVVGSRGHSRLLHLLLGSVAEALVREATIDVLVAKPGK